MVDNNPFKKLVEKINMMIKLKIIPTTIWLSIIFQYFSGQAQWSTDPTQNLQVSPFGENPVACPDGHGGAYVFWRTGTRIFGNKLDRYGYVKWATPIEIQGPGDYRTLQKIIADGSGNAILAYLEAVIVDTIGPPPFYIPDYDIHVQKIDSLGNVLWGNYGVLVSPDTFIQSGHEVIPNGQGGAFVVWVSGRDFFADTLSLYAQHLSSTGQRLWGDNGKLIFQPLFSNSSTRISSDNHGGFVIQYYNQSLQEFVFQRFNSNGDSLWTTFSPHGYIYINPLNSGGAFLAGYLGSGSDLTISANLLSPTGEFMWGNEGIIVEDSIGFYSRIKHANIREDSVQVIYWDKIIDPVYDYNAMVQFIDYNGNLGFPNGSIPVSSYPSNKSGRQVILSDNNSTIYVWFDGRFANDSTRFFCQKLDVSGNRLWDSTDVLISNHTRVGGFSFISDGNGGMIAFWEMQSTFIDGIFAQQVNRNGRLGVVLTGINNLKNEPLPKDFLLYPNYPNPFNSTTSITFSIPRAVDIRLEIYDVLGQRVRTLISNHLARGNYLLTWDGKKEAGQPAASGIYYARLSDGESIKTIKMLLVK